ncbi:ABC transporter substrate-binding protein [Planktothrix pseudagardhii]|uniref:Transmembrane sensor domain protein n=1 Tax=Planktothrix pseudagardhii TaxID=132604 RepID=A0A9W4GCB3_9CYAN|nr:ABC transporter substrate-binding protein [Planktothrix pseudagardhii]CAD5988644.1 Putative transmembrane sensor domain protein [Planktothrix pseudagardhii]
MVEQLVIFKIGEGNFEQGFPVTLQIREKEQLPSLEITGKLPPFPELPQLYRQWQATYRQMGGMRIKVPPTQVTHVSYVETCEDLGRILCDRLNQWLTSEPFRRVRETLIENLQKNQEILILVQTQDALIQRLPWNLCELFERYPRAEVALAAPDFKQPLSIPIQGKIKVLAILGDSQGINTQLDQQLLEKIPDANLTLLVQPQRQQLNDLLWKQQWDILFFAGHSSTETESEVGRIYINETESLTLEQLKYSLKTAVDKGLKLAIFNSCEGLGLARSLFDLQIPQVIVMREPVPDQVAQKFLSYFLETFAKNIPFYLAVRKAREQLQGLEAQFPCATWLPVIYQNPAQKPLTWLHKNSKINRRIWILFSGILCTSLALIGLKIFYSPPSKLPNPTSNRISVGDKILVPGERNSYKQKAAEAFSHGDFATAIKNFESALRVNRNDPEALIYLNNARIGNQRAVKVAVSVPIGQELNIANEILRGVAQGQNEINTQEKIQGLPLKVEIANDENEPAIAQEIATEFVKDSTVIAVIGHNASETSLAVAPIYQQGKLVMISPTSSTNQLSGFGRYIFRTIPSVRFMVSPLVQYVLEDQQIKKIIICFDSQAVDNSFKNEFVSEAANQNLEIAQIPCDFSDPNFNPITVISQALNAGAEGLLLATHIERIDLAIDVMRANQNRLNVFGTHSLYTARTLQPGEKVNGLVVSVPWHPAVFADHSFVENAMKTWGGAVNWRSATAYDATQAVITALKQSQTREGLQQTLSKPDFSAWGAMGEIEFLPSGDRKATGILVQIQPNLTGTGYEFVPLLN